MAKLMKHGIKNLIKREEIPIPVWPSKPQLHMHPTSHIQPQKSWIFWTANLFIYNYHSIWNTKQYKLRPRCRRKKPKLMCLIRLPINLTKQNCRVLTIVECTWELKTTYQKSINIQLGQWKFFNKVKIKNKFTIKYQSYPCLMQEWYKWFT